MPKSARCSSTRSLWVSQRSPPVRTCFASGSITVSSQSAAVAAAQALASMSRPSWQAMTRPSSIRAVTPFALWCRTINDMDTISAAALARGLGTSVPRVTRAARQLSIDARQANGHYSFAPLQADRVRRALGMTPRAEGLSRSEVMVLAALRNAPLGLVSARSVARRSGLSPTAVGRALESLRARELVEQKSELVAAGRAREMEIWRANLQHPLWPDLDPVLERVKRPERPAPAAKRVPRRLRHLFWNTAESQLDVDHAGAYIARRLLRTMDLQGLAWGAQALEREDWERAASARGLDPKVRRLARNLAEASR